ncbi:hypothetical protein HBB16_14145 [Pseudonocardia sp. MCCB 268]|nr:hypothetical protein [Pseudonocardia cytotoxica]
MLSYRLGHYSPVPVERGRRRAQNYYTGAVAEGNPPGRWWGAGAEARPDRVGRRPGRTCALQALPGPAGRRVPATGPRWDGVPPLGHTGRVPVRGRPHARRRWNAGGRLGGTADGLPDRGRARPPGTTSRSWTPRSSVQKSVTLLHTAFRGEGSRTRKPRGDENRRRVRVSSVGPVQDAIWTQEQRRTRPTCTGQGWLLPGSDTTAAAGR